MKTNIWNELLERINNSQKDIVIINGNGTNGEKCICDLNMSSNSVSYSIIKNSAMIVVDNWIRIYGQGNDCCESVIEINRKLGINISGMFIIANDVVGGIYAINQGRFEEDLGLVWYFAPDTLEWESLSFSYSEFIIWVIEEDLDEFYLSMRWNNWRRDVVDVGLKSGIMVYPFLWSEEVNIDTASKKIVPWEELFYINMDYVNKFVL